MDYPSAQMIKLETNYRSTPNILALANHIFRDKSISLRKNLRPAPCSSAPAFQLNAKIHVAKFANDSEEAEFIMEEIRNMVTRAEFGFEDIALLFRLNHQKDLWRNILAANRIPEASPLNRNGIALSTMHGAKGLEFPVVFYIGLDEKISPHFRPDGISPGNKPAAFEEEKRLFYVGVTRAKYRLYLTSARVRNWYGKRRKFKESRFLKHIPASIRKKKKIMEILKDIFLEGPEQNIAITANLDN
jgi:DNA helicase II / ATP-dependent DNA helicase PcrA